MIYTVIVKMDTFRFQEKKIEIKIVSVSKKKTTFIWIWTHSLCFLKTHWWL